MFFLLFCFVFTINYKHTDFVASLVLSAIVEMLKVPNFQSDVLLSGIRGLLEVRSYNTCPLCGAEPTSLLWV